MAVASVKCTTDTNRTKDPADDTTRQFVTAVITSSRCNAIADIYKTRCCVNTIRKLTQICYVTRLATTRSYAGTNCPPSEYDGDTIFNTILITSLITVITDITSITAIECATTTRIYADAESKHAPRYIVIADISAERIRVAGYTIRYKMGNNYGGNLSWYGS